MSTDMFSIAILIMCLWAVVEGRRQETLGRRLIWTVSAGVLALGEAAILLPR